MSAFRLTRLGAIAPVTLVLALYPSLARAQADATPPPAGSEPAATAPAAAAPEATPAPAPSVAVADPATPSSAQQASTEADAKADAAAEAEAAAAATEVGGSQGGVEETDQVKLNLYGFADFSYSTPIGKSELAPPYSSFAIGKLNLYAAADLGDSWRSMAEIRFMYLPNGSTGAIGAIPAPPRTDTSTNDYTDLGRPVKWGGISIERAWLEHTFHPALTVRMGAFLTPYGIWNVDHGSPVIIGVRKPYIIGEGLFPEHQTGLEIYGSWNLGPSQVGYHLTLSNGRGPLDSYQDLDHNKALGGRLFVKHDDPGWGTLTVGASGYKGTYTDSHDAIAVTAAGSLNITHPITAQYKELSLAADAKWELGGLLVQSELVVNEVAYTDGQQPPVYPVAGGAPGFAPDHRRVGVYGITGYRFKFLGIMPFFGGEHYNPGPGSGAPASSGIWGGLNVRPTARVVLKAQCTHAWFAKWEGPAFGNFNGLDLQAAWSF
jgi:hypothetical protein